MNWFISFEILFIYNYCFRDLWGLTKKMICKRIHRYFINKIAYKHDWQEYPKSIRYLFHLNQISGSDDGVLFVDVVYVKRTNNSPSRHCDERAER